MLIFLFGLIFTYSRRTETFILLYSSMQANKQAKWKGEWMRGRNIQSKTDLWLRCKQHAVVEARTHTHTHSKHERQMGFFDSSQNGQCVGATNKSSLPSILLMSNSFFSFFSFQHSLQWNLFHRHFLLPKNGIPSIQVVMWKIECELFPKIVSF